GNQKDANVGDGHDQQDGPGPPAGSDLALGRTGRRHGAHGASLRRWTSRSVIRTRTNDTENSKVATAAACSGRNWLVNWKMNTGAVSVFPVMFPETMTTAPNSPSARENDRRAPAATAGRMAGRTILRNVVHPEAPKTLAASTSAGSSSSRTGSTVLTTSGSVTNNRARRMPAWAKAIWTPCRSRNPPTGEPGPRRAT